MAKLASIIFILLLLSQECLPQHQSKIFEQYDGGYLADYVRCMFQDSRGFLWIGTGDELIRFDGYITVAYRPEPGDTNSISGNFIQCLLEDEAGMLWIGTLSNGLNKYNRFTNTFTRFQHNNKPFTISNNCINTIFEDKAQNLWIGTNEGLNKLDRNKNSFTIYKQGSKMISDDIDIINTIAEDESGLLWIGTKQGLYLFDRVQEKFHSFVDYYQQLEEFRSKNINILYQEDDSGILWIGTTSGLYQFFSHLNKLIHHKIDTKKSHPIFSNQIQTMCDGGDILWLGTANGLYQFDKKECLFTRYEHDPENYLSLLENNITAIVKDKGGCYWFGLYFKGINKINPIRNYFKYYFPNPFQSKSIEDKVLSLYESKSGNIWIGTGANGFLNFNKHTEEFKNFQHEPGNPNSLSNNLVRCFIEDHAGFVWIATGNGLNKFDPKTGKFIHFKQDPRNTNSLSDNSISSVIEAIDGSFYVGTYHGFNHFHPSSGQCTRFFNDPENPNSINNNVILTVYEDKDGIIWIGTRGGGLNRFDPKTGQFKYYTNDPLDSQSISSNIVEGIFEFQYENRPTLWIGTQSGGLCRFDKKTEKFHCYTTKDGLPANNRVQKIITDKKDNLWLATVECITVFDMAEKSFKNYELSSEMPVNPHTCLIDRDGEILFGGFRGLVRFFPDSIKNNPHKPNIVLTDFKVNYKPAHLDTLIAEKKLIVLSYQENIISFEFAALDFNCPELNQYAFKMDGVDDNWVYTDAGHRYASYTNLNPGEYVFHVKSSNNDGIWNEEGTSLKIIITPPWWKTSWAYGFYLLLMVLLIYGAWRFQLNRISMRHDLEMKQLHAEKLEEVDRMKSRFFANISHEFRTPLTLILGPISKILSHRLDDTVKDDLRLMQLSARRLQQLINQLLDLSKLEAGRMKLQVREENIVALLKSFVQSFESLAKLKNIQLVFQAEQENIPAYIDREKLETIINNLLSNAFKYTLEGGKVAVIVHNPPVSPLIYKGGIKGGSVEYIEITVSDTGIGIPSDSLDKIFDRFYQADVSHTSEPALLDISSSKKYQLGEKFNTTGQEGTGIGLALTKELVEFHKGEISVSSEIGKGTTFVIHLPITKDAYSDEEIVDIATPLISPVPAEEDKESIEIIDTGIKKFQESRTTIKKSLPILLIVEDNPDMRSYIRSNLENDYRILEAANGRQGFEKCAKVFPDLVISDVMMPEMDGFELCTKLKIDQRTSHIPVILLTARAAGEDKIGGLETGADDYIIKPFDARELGVRVKNLIEQRRKLRERYRKEGILQPQEIAVTSTDQRFLKKAIEIVEQYLSDEQFSVENLGKEIGMSRALLHRKMRALINHSPSEFIRSLRLNHAAQLLAKHVGNVTEIAFQVGFNNLSYFARCFHQQFGVSPSVYASQQDSK